MAKRETPEINAGSMADIAFLLLSFFLLTTTMDQNKGMPRRLPPIVEDKIDDTELQRRNILQVHVNAYDRLLVDGRPMEPEMLKEVVRLFITNPTNDLTKPEKEKKVIPELGEMDVSKAVVSLQTDRGTSYNVYMAVQNEIMKAYNELRDEFSMARFGRNFENLTGDRQDAVRKLYPLNISEAEPRDATKNTGSRTASPAKRRR